MKRPPLVSVVVLNWNGWEDTIECLSSLGRSSYDDLRIIVVDNGSTDGSPAKLRARPGDRHRSSLICNPANLGFAGGNNVGIERALEDGAAFVLILNNDATVAPVCVEKMVAAAEQDSSVGMVAPKVLEYDPPHRIESMGIRLTSYGLGRKRIGENDGPLFCPEGSCALFSRAFLESVKDANGYFDSELFAYFEDVDLGWRGRLRGFDAACAPDAEVFHKRGVSTRSDPLMPVYYWSRNTLRFTFKNFPPRWLARNAPWIIAAHAGGLLSKIGSPRFRPALRGKWDAFQDFSRLRREARKPEIREAMKSILRHLDPKRLPFPR